MVKVTFSLNASRSVGKKYGNVNVSAHVDIGEAISIMKGIFGTAS